MATIRDKDKIRASSQASTPHDTARLTHGRSLVMNMERLLSVRIKDPRRCAAPGSQEKARSLLVELKRAQGAGLGLRPSRPAASGSRA